MITQQIIAIKRINIFCLEEGDDSTYAMQSAETRKMVYEEEGRGNSAYERLFLIVLHWKRKEKHFNASHSENGQHDKITNSFNNAFCDSLSNQPEMDVACMINMYFVSKLWFRLLSLMSLFVSSCTRSRKFKIYFEALVNYEGSISMQVEQVLRRSVGVQ